MDTSGILIFMFANIHLAIVIAFIVGVGIGAWVMWSYMLWAYRDGIKAARQFYFGRFRNHRPVPPEAA